MTNSMILIYDKRVENSLKYKRILEQKKTTAAVLVSEKTDLLKKLEDIEPEMLLISESVNEDLGELCGEIRMLDLPFRPVIVLLSKSSFADDKLKALNSGADDFLSEPMETDEFVARINAHLRRTIEENSIPITHLPDFSYTNKLVKRTINTSKCWAMLYADIDNFTAYREIYGKIPAEKLLQTYAAILNASLEYDDFAGHVDESSFLVVTSSYKAEKLADYLNYAFDSIVQKFYTTQDIDRGFILLNGENKAGCKIPVMTTSIGVIDSEITNYQTQNDAFSALIKVQQLAKTLKGSAKVTDRPKISGENHHNEQLKNIFIFEEDVDLAYLLETTLQIQGFCTTLFESYELDIDEIKKRMPEIIIIDSGKNSLNKALELCRQVKENSNYNLKIIFTDTMHEKEAILNAGADLYFPKPYELPELFKWIEKLI